jgi:hypothetical protein
MKLVNKPEITKAIKKLNKNKKIKQGYFDQLVFAHGEAEKTLFELEEALRGNMRKVQGRIVMVNIGGDKPDPDFLKSFLRGEE